MGTMRKVPPKILSSGWGTMTVDGLGGGKDFKLWPGGGRPWNWSEYGTEHDCGIQPGDVEEFFTHGCELVILTTGRMRSLRIAKPTLAVLKEKGIETIVVDTDEGIVLYNRYAEQGKAVGGLFHSTC